MQLQNNRDESFEEIEKKTVRINLSESVLD